MKKRKIIIGLFLLLMSLTMALVVVGQSNNNALEHKKQLYDRFEKVVKDKEPKFVGGRYGGWSERPSHLHSNVTWKFEEERVFVVVFDYYSEQEAKDWMRTNVIKNKWSPFSDVATKLTNLGDEALMVLNSNYPKLKNVQLMLRKGSVIMKIDATSPKVGKRFAKYLVKEIEEHDKFK